MKKVLPFLLVALLGFTACDPDKDDDTPPGSDSSSLDLRLEVLHGNDPLDYDAFYPNALGNDIRWQVFKIYLSDIHLKRSGQEDVEVADIIYLEPSAMEDAMSFELAAGEYDSLIYHIGVPVSKNGTTDPDFQTNMFGPGHPLNINNGMYWAWATGYRFMIIDGRVDDDPMDPDNDLSTFSFHLGLDTMYRRVSVPGPFIIPESGTTDFIISLDMEKTQYNESDTLDFSSPLTSQFHGTDLPLGFRFEELFLDALEHRFE